MMNRFHRTIPHSDFFCMPRKGSVLIVLVVTILMISVLGAALLSISATGTYHELLTANFARAGYMAESGKRYAILHDLPENTYVTVWEEGGIFKKIQGNVPPFPEPVISTEGFRISVNPCGITSAGIVNQGSPHAGEQTVFEQNMKGLPCWSFHLPPLIPDQMEDSCGNNGGSIKGSSWTRICEGKYGGAVRFGGNDYIETDFRPFCEIGNNHSFSISFRAKPLTNTQGTVLGVSDSGGAFSVGISGGNEWQWDFGDKVRSFSSVSYDRWQQVIVVYDSLNGTVSARVNDCSDPPPPADTYDYAGSGGSAAMPEQVTRLYIGAENSSGAPSSWFSGDIDEIRIYDSAMNPDDLKHDCPILPDAGEAAYYPFNGNAADESSAAPQFHGTVSGTVSGADRFGCADSAFLFDGSASVDGNIDPAAPMIGDYPFSLSAWIRLDSTDATEKVIFSLTDQTANNVQFGIYINEFAQPCIRAEEPGGAAVECGTDALGTGTWYFVTGIFEGEKTRELYIDGVSVMKSSLSAVSAVYNKDRINRWSAGRWGSLTPSGYFKGIIDDIAVWPQILSPEEISLMSQKRPD